MIAWWKARRLRRSLLTSTERNQSLQRRLVVLLLVFLVGNMGFDFWDEWRDEIENGKRDDARQEVQALLAVIEEQTSPEAQAAAQDAVQAIILTIDCNTRQAFQEALDALADEVLEPGAVLVTDNCPP